MFIEFGYPCEYIKIYVDNQSAIKLANNIEFHKRSKHIDLRIHFFRDIVSKGVIQIEYVPSKQQLADIFTKPLSGEAFCKLRASMNILNSIN